MIPSFDIPKTVSFFVEVLDFKVVRDEQTYVILEKDHCSIHILRAGENIGEMEFYLEVDDLAQVWEKMKDKISGMKVKEPFDRDYGMREIHVTVPETKTLLFIGQEV
jgi:catechol 2,3-dioxygenase-like lactoylglutathione lyase family enzyme